MAMNKWIGGFLGFITTQSVLGAIAGFVFGAIFDSISAKKQEEQYYGNQGFQNRSQYSQQGSRNGFLFSLMVLAADIIQADGKIMHSEMEYVRRFLRTTFGADAEKEGNDILLKLFDYKKINGDAIWNQQIQSSCREMAMAMPEEHRIQLMAFLAEIAKADGSVDETEIQAMRVIAINLRLNANIVDQMLALGKDSLEEAYKVLGVTAESTDQEIKQAYKKLVMQHHPDRVANLGDDVKEAATKKLQEINKAKEIIYKARHIQ